MSRSLWGMWSAVCLVAGVASGCDPQEEKQPDGPDARELSRELGVTVTIIENEVRQYLAHAPQGSVDFSKIGTVHHDVGYAVGVTLRSGMQIGFRFTKPPLSSGNPTTTP